MFTPIATILVSSTLINNPSPAPPNCLAAPTGASKEVQQCFEDACDVFQAAWAACNDGDCRAAASVQHVIDTNDCLPALLAQASRTHQSREHWIVLSFDGSQWSYSFDTTTPTSAIAYKF